VHSQTERLHQKDDEDYEFILGEMERFVTLTPSEQIQYVGDNPSSAFTGMKDLNGGIFPLSVEGQGRFFQIVERGLKHLGADRRRHRREAIVTQLMKDFVSAMANHFEINEHNAHDLFTTAIDSLTRGYQELTYYVPCAVVAQRETDQFAIGPVGFVLREKFLADNEVTIREAATGGDASITEIFLGRLKDFYSRFQWIASITVPPCDKEVSRQRAHECIQKALDVFKLLVGSTRASDVKQAYDAIAPFSSAELVSTSGTNFSLRFGGQGHDAVLNDRWYEQVTRGPAWPLLEAALSNYWATWADLGEIEMRFIDALAWHSDAISERDLGARIVKFWTAIERVLSVSGGSKIVPRAAVLWSEKPDEFDQRLKAANSLYGKRSCVIHGEANRSNESWYSKCAADCEDLSKVVLFEYLYSMRYIRSVPEPTDRKKLEAWLKRVDHFVKLGNAKLP
jgi:hypothetical protein